MDTYQHRRKLEIEGNRKAEAKNLLMDAGVKNRIVENASREFERYRKNCLLWTQEEWPKLTKDEQQWYKDEAVKQYGSSGLGMKMMTFVIFRLLGGCPYNKNSWVAENWEKGQDWLQEHADERPKTYFKDGYCLRVGDKLQDAKEIFKTWN